MSGVHPDSRICAITFKIDCRFSDIPQPGWVLRKPESGIDLRDFSFIIWFWRKQHLGRCFKLLIRDKKIQPIWVCTRTLIVLMPYSISLISPLHLISCNFVLLLRKWLLIYHFVSLKCTRCMSMVYYTALSTCWCKHYLWCPSVKILVIVLTRESRKIHLL